MRLFGLMVQDDKVDFRVFGRLGALEDILKSNGDIWIIMEYIMAYRHLGAF